MMDEGQERRIENRRYSIEDMRNEIAKKIKG